MDIVETVIERLPATPSEPITWVVYNDDHVAKTQELIDSIKGEGYTASYCNVVSRQSLNREAPGTIYYDPRLMDHIGNGAN